MEVGMLGPPLRIGRNRMPVWATRMDGASAAG